MHPDHFHSLRYSSSNFFRLKGDSFLNPAPAAPVRYKTGIPAFFLGGAHSHLLGEATNYLRTSIFYFQLGYLRTLAYLPPFLVVTKWTLSAHTNWERPISFQKIVPNPPICQWILRRA